MSLSSTFGFLHIRFWLSLSDELPQLIYLPKSHFAVKEKGKLSVKTVGRLKRTKLTLRLYNLLITATVRRKY